MYLDMCFDMCLDLCLDMCLDMYLDMCLGMYLDMCLGMELLIQSATSWPGSHSVRVWQLPAASIALSCDQVRCGCGKFISD